MGDTLLSKEDDNQSNTRRKSELSLSLTSQNPGISELKKHVTFPPDDTLVQIYEISPRSIKSSDSNDSSDSTDSSESDTDSETDSTSSSEASSEEGAHIKPTRKSQIEVTSARANSLSAHKNSLGLISKPILDHKINKHLSVKFNQSTQANKNEGKNNKSRPNLSTPTTQTLAKTRSLLTRTNSTLGASSTVPAKLVNFNNLARRSSFPAKKRPLLPARKTASARRGSEGSVAPSPLVSNLQTLQLQRDETIARLSKSLQSLTIEDAFIFPSIQTYELKLPAIMPHNTIIDLQETLLTDGRNSETSPPKSAPGEQKNSKPTLQGNRLSAWQMANGRAEDALETKPNIAQLWESTQTWPEF